MPAFLFLAVACNLRFTSTAGPRVPAESLMISNSLLSGEVQENLPLSLYLYCPGRDAGPGEFCGLERRARSRTLVDKMS